MSEAGRVNRKPIRRVCVVRFGGMGDILMSTPALRALSERFETREIDYIVTPCNQDSLTGISYIREVIEWDPRGPDAAPANLPAFLRRLRRSRYDLFINFQPSAKTLLISLAAGASRVLTFRKDMRQQSDTGQVRHAIEDFARVLRPLGITRLPDPRMDFFIPESAHFAVEQRLSAEGIGPHTPLILVNPGGTRFINRWPPEKFIALLDRCAEEVPDARLIITGGPDDVERAQQLASGVKPTTRVLNLAKRLSIKEMGALLTRTSVFVTPDTGPMHIASAVGAPMVVLSGAADPHRTGPRNPGDLIVIKRDLPCVPCRARSCYRQDVACMAQMPMELVFEAVYQRLAEQGILKPGGSVSSSGIERVEKAGLLPLPMLMANAEGIK